MEKRKPTKSEKPQEKQRVKRYRPDMSDAAKKLREKYASRGEEGDDV